MSLPFVLHLPSEPALRAVAGVAAGRYVQACGGAPEAAAAFAADVQRAVDAVGPSPQLSVAFDHADHAVTAAVAAASGTTHVRVTLTS